MNRELRGERPCTIAGEKPRIAGDPDRAGERALESGGTMVPGAIVPMEKRGEVVMDRGEVGAMRHNKAASVPQPFGFFCG